MNQKHRDIKRRAQQAWAACLRRHFGRKAPVDAAIARTLKELGYGG